MRPEIRFTPPRRARRRMAGLVIPALAVSNCEADKKGGTAHPGCYRAESCGGASLRPFRVPFRLFRVQTCYKKWLVGGWWWWWCGGGCGGCAKAGWPGHALAARGYITTHGVAVLTFRLLNQRRRGCHVGGAPAFVYNWRRMRRRLHYRLPRLYSTPPPPTPPPPQPITTNGPH